MDMTKITTKCEVWFKNDVTRNKSTIRLITYNTKCQMTEFLVCMTTQFTQKYQVWRKYFDSKFITFKSNLLNPLKIHNVEILFVRNISKP